MNLPPVTAIEENILCKNRNELKGLVERTLSKEKGMFLKILGKMDDNSYYVTVLIDDRKLLAIEAKDLKNNADLTGNAAMNVLRGILEGAVVIDVYPLDDIDVKTSVMENIEIYNATPKIPFDDVLSSPDKATAKNYAPTITPSELERKKNQPSRLKRQRMEIIVDAPIDLDPYIRRLIKGLRSDAKTHGFEFQRVEAHAKEVRYALGSGTAIHTTLEITGKLNNPSSLKRVKEILTSRGYKEAEDIKREIGKGIIITDLELKLV